MTDQITRVEIAKLELQPGDNLVVMTELVLSKEQCEFLADKFRPHVPDDVEVIVLSAGVTIEVLKGR